MIKYPPFEFWEVFKQSKGAMSASEAIFMYNACMQVPNEGVWVEMGTAYSKSAIVSLMAWVDREYYDFHLLEPEFRNDDFLKEALGNLTKFKTKFGGKTFCFFHPEYSTDFLPKHKQYGYIMWDSGDHGGPLVRSEKALLEDKVIPGGIIVLHDVFSQFTACTEAYEELIASGRYEPVLYNWGEINAYVVNNDLENGNDSWHQYPELPHPPNFISALKRK